VAFRKATHAAAKASPRIKKPRGTASKRTLDRLPYEKGGLRLRAIRVGVVAAEQGARVHLGAHEEAHRGEQGRERTNTRQTILLSVGECRDQGGGYISLERSRKRERTG